jgi:hypothetical protein
MSVAPHHQGRAAGRPRDRLAIVLALALWAWVVAGTALYLLVFRDLAGPIFAAFGFAPWR